MTDRIVTYAAIDSKGAAVGAAQFNAALASMRAGVATTAGALKDIGSQFFSLQGLIGSLAAAVSGVKVVSMADDYANLTARLALVTSEGTTAQQVLDGIAEAAQRARAPATQLAEIYTKNANALKDLGRSQSEGVRLAETLAKVVTVSGVAGQQASAGMLQLSQAIASGKFQGDEFRSVAENIPEVMRILQRETGKTAGELRKLAEEGKITGDTLVTALLNASREVDEKFAAMPQTATSSLALLSDAFSRTVGQIANESGVSKAWATALDTMREAVESPAFQGAMKATADALAWLGESFTTTARAVGDARHEVMAWLTVIQETTAYKVLAAAVGAVGDAFSWLKAKAGEAAGGLVDFAKANSTTFAAAVDQAKGLAEQYRIVAQLKGTITKEDAVKASDSAKKQTVKFGPGDNKDAENLEKRMRQMLEIERLQTQIREAEIDGNETVATALKNQLEIRQKVTDEMRKVNPQLAAQIEREILLGNEIERQAKNYATMRQIGEQVASTIASSIQSAVSSGKKFTEVLRETTAQIIEMVAKIALIEPLVKSAGKSFADAFSGSGSTSSGAGGLLSSIASYFSSAAGASASSASSASSWVTTVTGAGFANGGAFDGPVNFTSGGTRGHMGEAGPEAILPLKRGSDGKLGVASAGGQSAPTTINITVQGDATDETIERFRRVAAAEIAAARNDIVRSSVSAVRTANVRSSGYMRR